MALSTYDIGDTIRMTAVYLSTGGDFVDPTTVTFVIKDPSGVEVTRTSASTSVTHPSTGTFYTDFIIDEQGVWRWRSYSTGNIHTAGEAEFVARKQWVAAST
jgi:hypothetical protein